jgi:hypothetical protein
MPTGFIVETTGDVKAQKWLRYIAPARRRLADTGEAADLCSIHSVMGGALHAVLALLACGVETKSLAGTTILSLLLDPKMVYPAGYAGFTPSLL